MNSTLKPHRPLPHTRRTLPSPFHGTLLCALGLALAGPGCVTRSISHEEGLESVETARHFYLTDEKDVDILFVIDNSLSMLEEQENLALQFPRLVEALRLPQLDNRLPNIHIGVISTDLGAGNYTDQCTRPGGDGGRLQAPSEGCPVPSDPWISYLEGETNIAQGAADPIERVKEAFSCIAKLGAGGCAYEHQLESARRALDPGLQVNPGFIREEALLVVVFITDEDDCSARNAGLFDPLQMNLSDPLGPPDSYRCFEEAVTCDINSRTPGPRKNCQLKNGGYLYDVQEYVDFFRSLKPSGRVLLAALAGPPDNVSVAWKQQNKILEVKPSCSLHIDSTAQPALRIQKLVEAFGSEGQFTSICTDDFGPALARLGGKIVKGLGGQCIGKAPLTESGKIACHAGDSLGQGPGDQPLICPESTLDQVDCVVHVTQRYGPDQPDTTMPRCAPQIFNAPDITDCGDICPCWRLVPKADCSKQAGTSPYGLDILSQEEPPKGTMATIKCATSTLEPGSSELVNTFLDQTGSAEGGGVTGL